MNREEESERDVCGENTNGPSKRLLLAVDADFHDKATIFINAVLHYLERPFGFGQGEAVGDHFFDAL